VLVDENPMKEAKKALAEKVMSLAVVRPVFLKAYLALELDDPDDLLSHLKGAYASFYMETECYFGKGMTVPASIELVEEGTPGGPEATSTPNTEKPLASQLTEAAGDLSGPETIPSMEDLPEIPDGPLEEELTETSTKTLTVSPVRSAFQSTEAIEILFKAESKPPEEDMGEIHGEDLDEVRTAITPSASNAVSALSNGSNSDESGQSMTTNQDSVIQ